MPWLIQETIKYTLKKIFKIDRELYPLGLFTILFSIGLYTAGRGDNHPIWEIWAIVHFIIAVRYDIPETIITQDTLTVYLHKIQ